MSLESFLLFIAVVIGLLVLAAIAFVVYLFRTNGERDARFKEKEQAFKEQHECVSKQIEAGRKSMYGGS